MLKQQHHFQHALCAVYVYMCMYNYKFDTFNSCVFLNSMHALRMIFFSPFTLASQTPTLTKLSMPLIADTIFSSIGDYNSGMQALSCFTSKERVAKTYTYRVYSSLQWSAEACSLASWVPLQTIWETLKTKLILLPKLCLKYFIP